MFKVIQTECLKLKRSKMLWLIPVGALIPTLLSFLIIHANMGYRHMPALTAEMWGMLLQNSEMMMILLMGPCLFSLFSGFLMSREYQENTINQLCSYPQPRWQFLIGKLLVMLPIIVCTVGLSFLMTLGFGLIIPHQPLPYSLFIQHLIANLFYMLTLYALVPIAATLSLIGTNIIPPMVLGVTTIVANVIVIQSKYSLVFPWSAPFTLPAAYMKILNGTGVVGTNNLRPGVISLVLTFTLPLIFNLVYFSRADIHSGS
jgi:bacitracin transport system permease protein